MQGMQGLWKSTGLYPIPARALQRVNPILNAFSCLAKTFRKWNP